MTEFLVECFASRSDAAAVADGSEAARQAAEVMVGEGTDVRFLRPIFVPDDETCFYLYEASSAQAVREAATRAGLVFDRVAEAAVITRGEGT
ncbi:MAG TPA: nickel-binding protein [Candidatus Limnocylindrales bacterium]|nr:nickel-binding protein [Candidatus Limnocylindrales bacterium]